MRPILPFLLSLSLGISATAEEVWCTDLQNQSLTLAVSEYSKNDTGRGRYNLEVYNGNPDVTIKRLLLDVTRDVYAITSPTRKQLYSEETKRYSLDVDVPPYQTRNYTLQLTAPTIPPRWKERLYNVRIEICLFHKAAYEIKTQQIVPPKKNTDCKKQQNTSGILEQVKIETAKVELERLKADVEKAKADAERMKAEADKAKAEAEKAKAEAELARKKSK